MVVKGLTIQEYKGLLQMIKGIDYDLYIAIKLNVELGLTSLESVSVEIEDIHIQYREGLKYYILKINKGCKRFRNEKNNELIDRRERIVVCSTDLTRELEGYIHSERHEGKTKILQPKKYTGTKDSAKHDGIDVHTLEKWYRRYYINKDTGEVISIKEFYNLFYSKKMTKKYFRKNYKLLIPFRPHHTKRSKRKENVRKRRLTEEEDCLGGRHLHKYLIEAECNHNLNYNERQVEIHLGHRAGTGSDYGRILNPDLMFEHVEYTFGNKENVCVIERFKDGLHCLVDEVILRLGSKLESILVNTTFVAVKRVEKKIENILTIEQKID